MMFVLDTSYLVALFNADDTNHRAAIKKRAQLIDQQLLLAEYVVLELSTILGLRTTVETSKAALESLLNSKEIVFVPCGEFFAQTYERFHSQKKYALSFVDCALCAIRDKFQAQEIVTFDKPLKRA